MTSPSRLIASLLAIVVAIAAFPSAAAAQSEEIPWSVVACSGGMSTSEAEGLSLTGTLGQYSAGRPMGGGGLSISGGFWPLPGRCPADWNGDGAVNSTDISTFLSTWLDGLALGNLGADFNGDSAVNSNDISAFLAAWLAAVQDGC